ncbi:MAG: undecaprenyldiphospho-muramoylpentapeptide beta-N-acetylglucosaminyltransferase [Candidatus Omnitrophota bacterium]
MRVAITCGGTGGHIFPAIALAGELKRKGYSHIVFIVDDNERAISLIQNSGFDFMVLKVPKMPYGFSIKWPSFFIRLFISRLKAEKILIGINPDVVAGFGAYISGPVVHAAKFIGKKVLIHEQNADLGRANRLLLPKADKVCFSFDNKLIKKSKKYVLTGNPVREELIHDFKSLLKDRAIKHLGLYPGKKTLLVIGGSRGASAINRLFMNMAGNFTKLEKEKIQIVHLTGIEELQAVSQNYSRNGVTHWSSGYFDEMALLYKAADLLICRSGAATITEASLFGVPAIFIPYPLAGNHQSNNAMVVVNSGGAIMLDEEDVTPDILKEQIFSLINNKDRMNNMRLAMHSIFKYNAAARLASELEELANA